MKPHQFPSVENRCMILTTPELRRKLKIAAALSGETMKEVLERLVGAEYLKLSGRPRSA